MIGLIKHDRYRTLYLILDIVESIKRFTSILSKTNLMLMIFLNVCYIHYSKSETDNFGGFRGAKYAYIVKKGLFLKFSNDFCELGIQAFLYSWYVHQFFLCKCRQRCFLDCIITNRVEL